MQVGNGESASPGKSSGASADIAIEVVPRLPGGRALMPVERDGILVWLLVEGHMSQQAQDEWLQAMQCLVGTGMWGQNFPPPAEAVP